MFDFILMTPVYDSVQGLTCWAVERSHLAGLKFMWTVGAESNGDALIARQRSIIATAFMEHGQSDYMIFLDSDIVFNPQDLRQLNEDQRAGYDLIGGVYPVRAGTQIASFFWHDKQPSDKPGIYEVQFLSTGFMGISKYLLQKMVKELKLPLLHRNAWARSYPFFEDHWGHSDAPDSSGATDIWISEDWDFCEKARKIGVKSYLDTRILLGHQAKKVVTMGDVLAYKQANKLMGEPRDYVAESTEVA